MKYELTNETHPDYPTLYRIRALRDIPWRGVKSGDLGGWVESESNLDQTGNAWVSDNALVYDNARVSGDARVYGDAWVYGNAQVSGAARVSGDARVYGDAWVSGAAWVYGTAWVFGAAQVYGDAQVHGDAQVYGDAQVHGDAWVYGTACLYGNARVYDNARVFESRHVITIGPVGSEDRTVTIHRIVDGGHRIAAGCWAGTADQLAERITDAWPDADPGERKAWKADYKAIIKLARSRAKEWNQ